MMMIGLPVDLEFREALNLTRNQLTSKLERRVKPEALQFSIVLRDPRLHFYVGIDSAAAVNCAARIGSPRVGVRSVLVAAFEIVIVK